MKQKPGGGGGGSGGPRLLLLLFALLRSLWSPQRNFFIKVGSRHFLALRALSLSFGEYLCECCCSSRLQ